MPKDGKKVAIGAGIAAALVGTIALIRKAKAAPPPPVPPPSLANFYGVVTDAETGNPIPDVMVILGVIATYTNEDGYYLFANILPGEYRLEFFREGYEGLVYPGVTLVEGNNELGVKMTLLVGVATLSGVTNIAGVKVSLEGPTFTAYKYTSSTGEYIFEHLDPGAYTITFEKEEYESIIEDIFLVAGSNELSVQMIPTEIPPEAPPDVRLSNLIARKIYRGGEQFLISVTAVNHGGYGEAAIKWGRGFDPAWGKVWISVLSRYIDYWRESATLATTVTLSGGESKTVSFIFGTDMPGAYSICVAAGTRAAPFYLHPSANFSQSLCVDFTSMRGQVPIERVMSVEEVNAALADP